MFLKTEKAWGELRINEAAKNRLKEAVDLFKTGQKKPKSFLYLFHGAAGSGKKTAASLLGNSLKKGVYKVDLSKLVSKYIGETEKNLDKLFNTAKSKEWILYFDEADALFGRRTDVKDSHDRYANIEINYLLQKIEDHAGMVILAAKSKSNIDKAFIRRSHGSVHFISQPDPDS